MEDVIEQPQLVTMAPGAIAKIKELIAEENSPNLKLRMFVSGGGCSGMQYGFTFEEQANEDDFDLEFEGIHLHNRYTYTLYRLPLQYMSLNPLIDSFPIDDLPNIT